MLFPITAALAAAAVVGAIIVYVSGTINRAKLLEKVRENGIGEALIEEINYCDNVIKVADMDSDKELEIYGDDIDWELDEGDWIYA